MLGSTVEDCCFSEVDDRIPGGLEADHETDYGD